jgi:uncharacterized membrane protein
MNQLNESIDGSMKKLTSIIYALYAVSVFFGITFVIAVIMNYVKRSDVKGTWLESHFNWQIRTFWVSLVGGAIGFATIIFFVGWVILAVVGVWFLYRVIKGWMYLNDNKEIG